MLIILKQLFILYVFLIIGWGFGKLKKDIVSHTQILSFLIVNLFLPAKVFKSFSTNFNRTYLSENYKSLIVSTCLLLLLVGISIVVSKLLTKEPYERKVYRYSIVLANYAYLGYVLVENLYGDKALTTFILFAFPFAIYTYSFGYMLLTESGGSFKRLFNPITCGILLGALVGLIEIPIPDAALTVISSSSACVGPLAMLLTGISLSQFKIHELVGHKMTYVMCVIRLIVMPLLIFGLFKLLRLEALLPYAVLMASMPTGLNTIVFPKLVGQDCKTGARLAFLTHLFSCVTIPVWLTIIKF